VIIKIRSGGISLGAIMKLICAGYVLGVGFIVVIVMLAAFFGSLASGDIEYIKHNALAFVLIPVILVLQAIFISLVVSFGLWLYRLYRPIKVLFEGNKA
jgi:hypothetical protein